MLGSVGGACSQKKPPVQKPEVVMCLAHWRNCKRAPVTWGVSEQEGVASWGGAGPAQVATVRSCRHWNSRRCGLLQGLAGFLEAQGGHQQVFPSCAAGDHSGPSRRQPHLAFPSAARMGVHTGAWLGCRSPPSSTTGPPRRWSYRRQPPWSRTSTAFL